MGYAMRLYIFNKYKHTQLESRKHKGHIFAPILATYEMESFIELLDLFNTLGTKSNLYIYPVTSNGTEYELIKDCYGKHIKELPLKVVQKWLSDFIKQPNYEYYRRIKPFLNLLKGFNAKDWDNLVVVNYGH